MGKRIRITFDRSAARFIMSCFKFKKICIICSKKITAGNIGGVCRKGFICNAVMCLMSIKEGKRGKD